MWHQLCTMANYSKCSLSLQHGTFPQRLPKRYQRTFHHSNRLIQCRVLFLIHQCLIYETWQFKCKGPRNRVYDTLRVVNDDGKSLGVVPDYTHAASEVHQDLARRHKENARSNANTTPNAIFCGQGVLQVAGIRCATVVSVNVTNFSNNTPGYY